MQDQYQITSSDKNSTNSLNSEHVDRILPKCAYYRSKKSIKTSQNWFRNVFKKILSKECPKPFLTIYNRFASVYFTIYSIVCICLVLCMCFHCLVFYHPRDVQCRDRHLLGIHGRHAHINGLFINATKSLISNGCPENNPGKTAVFTLAGHYAGTSLQKLCIKHKTYQPSSLIYSSTTVRR